MMHCRRKSLICDKRDFFGSGDGGEITSTFIIFGRKAYRIGNLSTLIENLSSLIPN